MTAAMAARRLQIRVRPEVTVSNPKKNRTIIYSFTHILMSYTLLLASITWYPSNMSWILQLTTWVLTCNCLFYMALLYINNAKKPFRSCSKETINRALSELLTITYVMNMTLSYYFVVVVYPKLKEPDAYRLLMIYMYPGLSVMMNYVIRFNYTKSLHFQGLGGSVIILTLYMSITRIVRHTFNGPMLTETELVTVGWFDPINLKDKFLIFIIVMTFCYLMLKLNFHMRAAFNRSKQKLRTVSVACEIHP